MALAFVSRVCEESCWRQKVYGIINIKKGNVTEKEPGSLDEWMVDAHWNPSAQNVITMKIVITINWEVFHDTMPAEMIWCNYLRVLSWGCVSNLEQKGYVSIKTWLYRKKG